MTRAQARPVAAAWGVIAVLFLASMVSTLDRALINLVVDPLKQDLPLPDVQVSLLQGLAFGTFYATVGVPVGLAADRWSRRGLIIAGVTVWSLATAASGYVASFGELFAARLLVGLGEAALVASSSLFVPLVSTALLATLQSTMPPDMRGMSVALTGLVNTLLGATGGPLLIALLTDHVFHDPATVGHSVAAVVVPSLLLASGTYAWALRRAAAGQRGR